MKQKAKAAPGATGNGLQNTLIAGGNQSYFQFDDATFLTNFQADLTAHLARHRTIRLACRCFACYKAKSPLKMFAGSPLCRDCIHELKGKGKTARNHFTEKVKANVGRFVRGLAV